jgi:hypothetical protein
MKAFGPAPPGQEFVLFKLRSSVVGADCGTEKEPGNKNINFIMRICFGIGGGSVSLHGSV